MINPGDKPHRRFNPLSGEWVLVSSHRTERPWSGQQESLPAKEISSYNGKCYLCPGNSRAGGAVNPDYQGSYVFDNDFPALLPEPVMTTPESGILRRWQALCGISRVICYSPRHDLSLPQLPMAGIEQVIKTWIDQSVELGKSYKWVQIFENKGAAMGASNPHPHGQLWASDFIPTEVGKEDRNQRQYYQQYSRPLLMDYLGLELESQERIVVANDSWIAAVPFWAVWPYETILLPRTPVERITGLNPAMIHDLASLMKKLLTKYDQLFQVSFPYSMGWHGAPFLNEDQPHWVCHAHIYPPLLRSAAIRKFMVGYELLAEPQRDLTPEAAADRLIALPETY